MRIFKIGLVMMGLLVLLGCQSINPQPVNREIAFSPEEYAQIEKTGTAAITGQLFLRTRGGDVKYGAGSEVIATPATRYTRETSYIISSGRVPEPADPRATEYTHRTIADGEGRFTIENLPAGRFIVAGAVYWESPVRYTPAQGGVVIKEVSVSEGGYVEIMLTK